MGLMGKVSMHVLAVSSSTLMSSCGVRKFIVGLLWLCMHIIDVSDGSMYR